MAASKLSPKQAAGLTLLCFLALFSFQLLWTHDKLERLRGLRRGLRRRASRRGGGAAAAEHIGARIDRLTLGSDSTGDAALFAGGDEATIIREGAASASARAGAVDGGGALRGVARAGALPNPAIIVFCFNRTDYLNVTLHSLLGLQGLERYHVYVSQDGNDEGVASLAASLGPTFLRSAGGFEFWQKHPRVPALGANQPGHAYLAQHYGWGLGRVFDEREHSHAVIVEDDMLFSPDFLLYFEATAPLLDADPTLWCISSWNDNGFQKGHNWDVRRLFRTSYFPGLGWMMTRQLWQELGPSWPKDHWDHWMRDDEVSKGRECIAPELNRNKNIGEEGANMNKQAFKRYLKTMDWNENVTVTDFGDLSHLLLPAYEASLRADMAAAIPFEFSYRRNAPKPEKGKTYLVLYTVERYTRISLRLKVWPYPRGHHRHVAVVPWEGSRFLVADRRFCTLLPKEHQLPPTEGMRPVPGKQWQSCRDACEERGLTCQAKDFWWLNSCAVMRKHFPCEHGCTIELGPDVPAYVMDSNQTLHQYCLITQKASTCVAKHASTARLCACVPKEAPKAQRRLQALLPTAAADSVEQQQQQEQQQGQQERQRQQPLGAGSGDAALGLG